MFPYVEHKKNEKNILPLDLNYAMVLFCQMNELVKVEVHLWNS